MFHNEEWYIQVLSEVEARNQSTDIVQPLSGDINVLMEKELKHFSMVKLIPVNIIQVEILFSYFHNHLIFCAGCQAKLVYCSYLKAFLGCSKLKIF